MPDYTDRMKDYVPVNERIEAFYSAFPNGSLQSEIVELTDQRVTVKAYAYRTPDDPRPGIGHSSLNIPGSTPYTKGSEAENAETSAWGRAIAALGFEVKRGIASAEEVRNKQPEVAAARTPAVPVAGVSPLAPAIDDDLPPLEEPPVERDDGFFEAVLATTGGAEERPPERLTICPVHGSAKVKRNARGLYCATKLESGEWCDWKAA